MELEDRQSNLFFRFWTVLVEPDVKIREKEKGACVWKACLLCLFILLTFGQIGGKYGPGICLLSKNNRDHEWFTVAVWPPP